MRNVVWSGSSVVMLTVCLGGGVATADDSTDLGSKFDAALSAVKSYQVDVTRGDQRSTTVVVHGVGRRYQSTSSRGDTTVYTVGTTIYEQLPGVAGWHKVVINRDDSAMFAKSASRRRSAEPLPDRTEDGVTVGAVRTTVTMVSPGMNPETITMGPGVCTYDKSTLLFRTCTFDHGTFSYSHYDDPSLTIELPLAAKNAPEIHLPVRSASPS